MYNYIEHNYNVLVHVHSAVVCVSVSNLSLVSSVSLQTHQWLSHRLTILASVSHQSLRDTGERLHS